MTNIFDFRLEMVRSAQQDGVSETARLFEVSRPTVYKWVHRFDLEGLEGLVDRSRRWHSKSEPRPRRGSLVAKSTAWEYYFNRLRPNSYQQNRTPYQRMKRAGISSKTAELACFSRRDPFRDGR